MLKRPLLLIILFFALLSCKRKPEIYLFSTFREPATDGLYLAYSVDGYDWIDLGGPYLKPQVGTTPVMRDPSVIRGADGTYHMVWTSSWKDDQGFGYASSKDLINWSEQRWIPVMQYEPTTTNVWAPEIFHDDEDEQYIIIWASTIPFRFERGEEEEYSNHRMYYTTTEDFKTFSPARLFLDPGFSIIDAVIVKRASKDYVLVLKDNTRPHRNLRVAFGESPLGPFTNISEPFTRIYTEGPTVIKQNNEWIIYYEAYRERVFGAARTSDFKTFTDITGEITLPPGHKHGTIFKSDHKTLITLKKEAERRYPEFRSHGCCNCEWDGAVWPFATSQTLTGMANFINNHNQTIISDSAFFRFMEVYVESQYYRGRPYIGEYLDERTGCWLKGDQERSRYYNHSTFCDLIITGIVGLRPRADDCIELNPLLPDNKWDWFCLDGINYHGKILTICWDQNGTRYNRGKGLIILANGREIGKNDKPERIICKL